MVTLSGNKIRRHAYDDVNLWTLTGNLAGTRAKKVLEKVELHFREGTAVSLVLDLRQTTYVDSEGAVMLERARLRHPGLSLVGLPKDFANLPLSIQATLDLLRPAPNLQTAFSAARRPVMQEQTWPHHRRHSRIPVQIPVELYFGTMSTAANLHDLSPGGVRIGRLPFLWHLALRETTETACIKIAGMDSDPLGREIMDRYQSTVVDSRPLYVLPDYRGVGAQFSETTPAPQDATS